MSSPWTFYHHHVGLTSIPPPLMYARTIQHIVDPTARPSQWYPPHVGLPSNTHLALSQIFALFSCRSVFSRVGTVARSLSPSELSRVYDLPPFLGSMFTIMILQHCLGWPLARLNFWFMSAIILFLKWKGQASTDLSTVQTHPVRKQSVWDRAQLV